VRNHLRGRRTDQRRLDDTQATLRIIGCLVGGAIALVADRVRGSAPGIDHRLALLIAAVSLPAAWLASGAVNACRTPGCRWRSPSFFASCKAMRREQRITMVRDRLIGIVFATPRWR
jgi:hypothetical protein